MPPNRCTSVGKICLVDMAFVAGQRVVLKMNGVCVGIGDIVLGSTNHVPPHPGQICVKALRLIMVSTSLSSTIHTLEIVLAIM